MTAPPGPPGGAGGGLPWEDRRDGSLPAFGHTLGLLARDPRDAFSRLRRDGDLVSPLLFGLAVTLVGVLAQTAWSMLFQGALQSVTGAEPELFVLLFGGGAVGLAVALVLAPFIFVLATFVVAAIQHGTLFVLGGLERAPLGFEGTLKVVCYSSAAQLLAVVPLLGGVAALLVQVILQTLGLATVHRTGAGRALVAVLVPWALCCAATIASMGAVVALFGGILGGG